MDKTSKGKISKSSHSTDETVDLSKSKPGIRRKIKKPMQRLVVVLLAIMGVVGGLVGYIYAVSPTAIRNPKLEHYHFRMQILVNGKAENFADDKYQQDYVKNQCSDNLPEQPIHFHDRKDQLTHIHWQGITGGIVMKYYGWNYIGGINEVLGYRLDDLGNIQKVNTHGNLLSTVPDDATFYIYTGDENSYREKSFDDWKNQNIEQFFEKSSSFPALKQNERTSLLDRLFPKAYAHGTSTDEDGDDGPTFNPSLRPPPAPDIPEKEKGMLTRINNLIGNVVIFAQKNKPTDQEIKDRFNDLESLPDSLCGG